MCEQMKNSVVDDISITQKNLADNFHVHFFVVCKNIKKAYITLFFL